MTTELQVAKTILEQLGGNRFVAMTGARNFTAGSNFLLFSLPRAKASIRKVRIILTPADLYRVEFFGGRDMRQFHGFTHDGVYCDKLQSIFTAVTGLYTTL